MNTINFNQSVGFPLETEILDEMQKAYSLFNALGALAGDFSIISGCELTGATIADGVVFINGEVLEFRGGVVQTNVIIVETKQQREFEDFVSRDVIFTRYATFGTATTQWLWADFKPGIASKLLPAMFAGITTQLETIIEKLNTIERDAKVQLQSDFNQNNNTLKDFIKNKPNFINFLHRGVFAISDVGSTDELKTVTFPTVGTNNYMIVGSMVSLGSNFDVDNDVVWMVREKTNTSFKITLRELTGGVQNLSFEYMLIPL